MKFLIWLKQLWKLWKISWKQFISSCFLTIYSKQVLFLNVNQINPTCTCGVHQNVFLIITPPHSFSSLACKNGRDHSKKEKPPSAARRPPSPSTRSAPSRDQNRHHATGFAAPLTLVSPPQPQPFSFISIIWCNSVKCCCLFHLQIFIYVFFFNFLH